MKIAQNKACSPYSRKKRRTCFRRCSKENFKAVNTSIANISCEQWIHVVIILFEDQGIREKLKKRVCNHVLAILTTYMETMLKLIPGEIDNLTRAATFSLKPKLPVLKAMLNKQHMCATLEDELTETFPEQTFLSLINNKDKQ